MGKITVKQVFEALNDRLSEHELYVDRRLNRVQTAITKLETDLQRRIDKLDGRIDEIREKPDQPPNP